MELYQGLFQHSADGVLIARPDGSVLRANPAACRLLGRSEAEVQGQPLGGLLVEEAGAEPTLAARALAGIDRGEVRLRRPGGDTLLVELTSVLVRSGDLEACAYVIFRDVGARHLADAALRASEERFRQLAENARDVFWLLDVPEGKVAYVNPAFEAVWGQTCQSRYEDPAAWAQAIHPDDRPRVLAAYAANQAGEGSYDEEYRLLRPDGSVRWIRDRAAPVRDAAGKLVRLAGIAEDVTARKAAEAALRRSMRALLTLGRCNEALVRAAGEQELYQGVCRVIVEEGGYRLCWVGLAEHDVRQTIRPVAQAGQDDGYVAALDAVASDTERGQGPTGTAVRTLRPVIGRDFERDPTLAPWRAEALRRGYRSSASLPLVIDGACAGVLSIYAAEPDAFSEEEVRLLGQLAEDLAFGVAAHRARADRDRLTAQLVQADRLVAMGTLAAGVAHEINNPLAYVIAALDHLEETMLAMPAGPPGAGLREAREVLAEAREGAERVRLIVRDLKSFSRVEDARVERVDLRKVLEASINIAMNELKHRARLVTAFGQAPLVLANEAKLGQVFLNLLINAAQAIPPGHVDQHEIRVTSSTEADGRARVEVSDTGAGIPPALADRIFEPFVTSKRPGEGTGLGLSICRSVVGTLGGEVGFESAPGQGATFWVVLPAAGPEEAVAPPTPSAPAPVEPGPGAPRGRVAVVDDEPAIRRSVARALGAAHDVEVFDGARALEARLAAGGRFDVILCDLMMPEMTGMELHRLLRVSAPGQAAAMVFMTGGAFTAEAQAFLDEVPNPNVEKPFDLPALRALVRSRVA
jgi:PAS domain S-box-containing protein